MNNSQDSAKISPLLFAGLLFVILVALLLRAPYISADLPFFYDEDEGHHYNRVVEMVKNGKYDPEYFRKPSLHFYMRMPVVAASFLYAVRRGEVKELKDIKTRDAFGLSKYAFTAFPQSMVKWNRALSVTISLAAVLLTFLIVRELTNSGLIQLGAAALTAISPTLVADSAKVGVDTLMATMVLLSVYLALKLYRKFSIGMLIGAGIAAGLAVSSKYNALPVVVLPLITCLVVNRVGLFELLLALISPIIGFIIGTPFALLSLPLFLDQFAYEVWHYGVEGHQGHMAEPGWEQAVFYFNWFSSSALGMAATVVGILGFIYLLVNSKRERIILAAFPILFSVLMLSQKTNFTRNMLVVIPFLAITAAMLSEWIAQRFPKSAGTFCFVLIALLIVEPCFKSINQYWSLRETAPDTRLQADQWLQNNQAILLDTALSGELLMPYSSYTRPGAQRFDPENETAEKLYLAGFDQVVTKASLRSNIIPIDTVAVFPGEKEKQRIIMNPHVQIFKLSVPKDYTAIKSTIDSSLTYSIFPPLLFPGRDRLPEIPSLTCYRDPETTLKPSNEGHCWLRFRFSKIALEEPAFFNSVKGSEATLELEVMTPWPKQSLVLSANEWKSEDLLAGIDPGVWKVLKVAVPLKTVKESGGIYAHVAQVHSPKSQGINDDERRLGVALKYLKVGN